MRRRLQFRSPCWLAVAAVSSIVLARMAISAEVPQAVLEAEQQRIANIAKASEAAVSIFELDGKGGGSGVVISPDGYALTNFHVVQPCGEYMKCGMSDGQIYDAVIVGIDPTGDVALIKLLGRDDFPTATMGDSDSVRVGDWCFAVGNPFLLATDLQPTVSYGIVSGVHRYQYPAGTLLEYADCIQTDAAINPGNSGGPLFNADGLLIGVNGRGSFEKRGRVNVGVGYAISINQIKHFLGYLHSGRIVDHATLGATVASDDRGRVVVSNILENSDTFRRGLRYGDELLAFGGRRISTVNGFKNVLGIYPRDWRVPLSFQRGGRRQDVFVRLAGVHSREQLIEKVQQAPQAPRIRPGPDPDPDAPAPDAPGQPGPQQPRPGRPDAPRVASDPADRIPEAAAKLIERRRGYANYYFNRLHRDRVWQQLIASGDFQKLTGPWFMEGESAESRVELEMDDEMVFARLPSGPARVDLEDDLGSQLEPIGSGGMLVAIHLWKRFLTLGPEQYGEVYYLGECPLPGRSGLFDVLVATHDVTEVRFYFEPASGRLAALEMFPDLDQDPCEIYFDDYQSAEGRLLPHRLAVVFGDDQVADIRVAGWKLTEAPDATKEATSAP
jgi:serine protease Do